MHCICVLQKLTKVYGPTDNDDDEYEYENEPYYIRSLTNRDRIYTITYQV